MYEYEVKEQELKMKTRMWTAIVIAVVAVIVIGAAVLLPPYNVWASAKAGEAEYVRAEQNRKIKIEEAKANLEAEKLNAQAEIERARGAAEAIRIENGSITPTYIQYLWVRQQGLSSNNKIVYIPTEAGLPILEAGREH